MKTILEIDHQYYVLPASANVNLLIKTLAGAKRADRRFRSEDDLYELRSGPPRIEIAVVSDKQILDANARKRLPEKASEDCHGSGLPITQ